MKKKKKICQIVYKLLSIINKNNQKNKEKSSKFLPIFAIQAEYISGAYECIFSIISNYEELLLTIHKDEQIFDENSRKSYRTMTKRPMTGSIVLNPIKNESLVNTKFHSKKKEIAYINFYNKIYDMLLIYKSSLNVQWDLIGFFAQKLQKKKCSLKDTLNILKFFMISCKFQGEGVNVNQELIFKLLNFFLNIFFFLQCFLFF